jgi:type I restriction enzyme S subunit
VKCIDEIPFEVPKGWVWTRLGNLCDYGTCSSENPSDIPDDAWILDLEDIEKDTAKLLQRIQKEDRATTSTRHSFKKGNVLYSKLRTYLNKILVADMDGFCTTEILPLDFRRFVIPEYARHTLMSQMFLDYTAQCGYGVKMPRLGTTDGKNALFPLPPLKEQKRIVAVIESAFTLIDEIEDSKLSLEQFVKQAKSKTLDLAIRGKLVPQDPNDEPASVLLERIRREHNVKEKTADNSHYPFMIPDSWTWCKLNEISTVLLGKTLDKQKNKGNYRTYLRSVNVRWGCVDLEDLKEMKFEESEIERYSIAYGDLLICEGGEAGRCAVWKFSNMPMRYQNAIHRVRFYNNILSDFYMYALWNYHNNYILDEYCKGVTIKHLTGQALNLLYLPLPPLEEQQRIVEKIEQIFSQLDKIEQSIKA